LRQGQVDAVFAWAVEGAAGDLRTLEIGSEETLVALPADHPLAARAAVPAADLHGERIIMFPRPAAPAVWDRLAERLSPGAADRTKIVEMPASGQRLMVEAVARGEGICPISARLAAPLATPGVVFKRFDPPQHVPLHLAWTSAAPAAVRALVEQAGSTTSAQPAER
jgi:DNA-binding transcriptional LysR family regulator